MKILHVITSLRTGGAEKLMVDLLPLLRLKGAEVHLCIFDGSDTPFKEAFKASGIKLIEFSKGRNVYSPANLLALIKLIRKNDYDIIHTHNTAAQLFGAISSLFCRVTLSTTEHNTTNRRRTRKWLTPIDRWMYSKYKAIISISDKTQESLLNYCFSPKSIYQVIYNGVPLECFKNAYPNPVISEKFSDVTKIIMVAGFRYQKDHETAIRSLTCLSKEKHLFLVGDGIERGKNETLVKELNLDNRVHFMGQRSDVPALLKSSDLCVVSSHWEGFGLAAVEGMAAGKPVIASDVPGVAEIVRGAGLLFEHGNPVDLAKQINLLIDNPHIYDTVSRSCIEKAQEFSIEKMADSYFELYTDLYKNENYKNLNSPELTE